MKESGGSLATIIALKFTCCGALILFLYGGLNFGALAAWAAVNGIWWGVAISIMAMAVFFLVYIHRQRARSMADRKEIDRKKPASRPVRLSS